MVFKLTAEQMVDNVNKFYEYIDKYISGQRKDQLKQFYKSIEQTLVDYLTTGESVSKQLEPIDNIVYKRRNEFFRILLGSKYIITPSNDPWKVE
jgi:hypothetical protein